MMRALFFGVVFLGASVFVEANDALWGGFAQLPVPEVQTLSNGLTVVWFENDRLPLIDTVLMVKSGYRDDPRGKPGVAQLTSSMLDRGAGGVDAQTIARSIERLGASRYSTAGDDHFTVGLHGLSDDSELLLGLLARISLQPDFLADEFRNEKKRFLDRWQHIGDSPSTLATLVFRRLVSSGTTYGRGGFLSENYFDRINREDLVRFHKRHFVPRNSILMVVGNVNRAKLLGVIKREFGAWVGPLPERNWRNYTSSKLLPGAKKGVIVHRPGMTQAEIRVGFPGPLVNDPTHYALVVANTILGEFFNSRLNSVLRDDLALTYSVKSAFSYSKDFGAFVIDTSTGNETVGRLLKKTLEVLNRFRKEGVTSEEVETAKQYLVGGFPLETSTVGLVASRWLVGRVFQLGNNYLNEFIPKVLAVTPEEVTAAVKKHFRFQKPIIVISGDEKLISASLKKSDLFPFKKIPIKDLY